MLAKFISTDRVEVAVNAAQVTFVSSVSNGTRIRFGAGRTVTVTEPLDDVMTALNRTLRTPQD